MQLDLKAALGAGIDLSEALPDAYRGPVLKGSEVLTAHAKGIGRIVQQEFLQPGFSICLHAFNLLRPFKIKTTQSPTRLVSLLALKNNMEYNVPGFGGIQLKQGQFALLQAPEHALTAKFRNQKPHESMVISWTGEWLQPLRDEFPLLQTFQSTGASEHPLLVAPRSAGMYALDSIQGILRTPLDESKSRLLFENKVKEYLIFLLVEAGKQAAPTVMLSAREREMLMAVAQLIQQTYDRRFSLQELSRRAGINMTKFKDAFKEVFGTSPGQMNISVRLHEARRLLMETDLSTKQIKDMVNYKLTTSFIEAFHEFFGYYPSQVPRKLLPRKSGD